MKTSDQTDFMTVTEAAGQRVSVEQLDRTCHRYHWALGYCEGKDVLEVACGAGQGLALLSGKARTLAAGDISATLLKEAEKVVSINRAKQVSLSCFPAEALPFSDSFFDTILLFEALYYLDAAAFFREVARVLRPGGHLLLVSANPALADFNPSPFCTKYYDSEELLGLCRSHGLEAGCAGYVDVRTVSVRQRVLRPLKQMAVHFGLVPKTMHSKELLKKLFFGKMTVMPPDISTVSFDFRSPTRIPPGVVDRNHKVIYCLAKLQEK